MFKFLSEFVFLDHSEGGIEVIVNVLRKYTIHFFHKTVPPSSILRTLSCIVDVILKLHNKDLENIQDDMYSVRENVLYMLSFEKFLEEKPTDDNDNDDESKQM